MHNKKTLWKRQIDELYAQLVRMAKFCGNRRIQEQVAKLRDGKPTEISHAHVILSKIYFDKTANMDIIDLSYEK